MLLGRMDVNERAAQPRRTRLLVAVDGPAGSGKSTLGRALAAALGLPYVNTGLMYRAVARRALERGVALDDERALAVIASGLRFDLDAAAPPGLTIDGRDPDDSLSSYGVEAAVSRVAAHPAVRAILRDAQRRLGAPGAVMEGRDIASVVFPDAEVKIFLSAPGDVRGRRRRLERRAAHAPGDVVEALSRRDLLDSRTNPLEPASGATVIDTTAKSPEDVAAEALRIVKRSIRARGKA